MFPIATGLFLLFTQFYSPFTCYKAFGNPGCISAASMHVDFTVHGLWSEFTNDTYPSYCNKSAHFNVSELSSLTDYLNAYWVSYEGPNPPFWEHEYLKHATCFPNTTELQFFQDGIDLYQKLDTTAFLQSHVKYDINYTRTDMEKLFNGKFKCASLNNSTNNTDIKPQLYVEQFWKCYDVTLKELTCPSWLNNNSCTDYISFNSW